MNTKSQPERHHPLVEAAIRTLVEGEGGVPEIDALRLPALTDLLATYSTAPDLAEGVRELILFAVYLGESYGARAAAMQLLEVAAAATPALELRAAGQREDLRRAQARAASFLGRDDTGRSAPQAGATPPAGAVALSSLLAALPGRKRG